MPKHLKSLMVLCGFWILLVSFTALNWAFQDGYRHIAILIGYVLGTLLGLGGVMWLAREFYDEWKRIHPVRRTPPIEVKRSVEIRVEETRRDKLSKVRADIKELRVREAELESELLEEQPADLPHRRAAGISTDD